MHLKLSPEFLAMAARMIDDQLDPAKVRPALGQVNYAGPGLPKVPDPAQAAGASPGVNPALDPKTPVIPPPQPLVPAGAGPSKPKAAGISDIAEAVAAIPSIESAIGSLKNEAKAKVISDWGKLKPGEKAAVVTTVVSIGIGALGGVASDPAARSLMLSQLNGKVLPVPKVPWLSVEVNTGEGNMMFGLHVDVGQLLPPSLGFGPGSPTAFEGPPGQREAADGGPGPAIGDAQSGGGTAHGVRALAGSGMPLPSSVRDRFETGLGTNLRSVRVHTGPEADRLARSVDAVAFTSGQDIFFRAGAYAPGKAEGLRLLAHETAHTVQQRAGPVAGVPTPGGLSVSQPGDPFEVAAKRDADRLARPPEPFRPGHRWSEIRAFANR
jgi:hypothetical protein